MGLMDRIKKVTGTEDGYGYDDDVYYDEFDNEENMDAGMDQTTDSMNNVQQPAGMSGMSSMGSGISLSSGTALELKVVKPQSFESVPQIADHLLNKRTVVLNLENTNKETARRLIDFLSGVAYSIDGALKKVATNTYIISPSNVDIGDAQLRDKRRAESRERPAPKMDDSMDAANDLNDF